MTIGTRLRQQKDQQYRPSSVRQDQFSCQVADYQAMIGNVLSSHARSETRRRKRRRGKRRVSRGNDLYCRHGTNLWRDTAINLINQSTVRCVCLPPRLKTDCLLYGYLRVGIRRHKTRSRRQTPPSKRGSPGGRAPASRMNTN